MCMEKYFEAQDNFITAKNVIMFQHFNMSEESLHLLKNFHPILTNFSKISDFIKQPVDGILFDLGLNNHQLISSSRGFSFNDNTSLDMRLDPSVDGLTAEYIINTYDFQQLTTIFSKYSQEKFSKDIASEIIKQRQHAPIKTAVRLAEIITKIYQQHQFKSPHHPATKVFLSLRIAVNQVAATRHVDLHQLLVRPGLHAQHGQLAVGRRDVLGPDAIADTVVVQVHPSPDALLGARTVDELTAAVVLVIVRLSPSSNAQCANRKCRPTRATSASVQLEYRFDAA